MSCTQSVSRVPTASPTRTRCGYTLLELLLALALTIIVISTIATAIQVNLFSLSRAQASIERKQVARSVMAMIGNDIRAAVQFRAVDFAGLEEVLQSQQLIAGIDPTASESSLDGSMDDLNMADFSGNGSNGNGSDENESNGSGSDENAADENGSNDDTADEDGEEEEATDWSIGLIGQSNYIWLDISRLPRIDQYHPLIRTAQDEVRTGSDIKQVIYYVAQSTGENQSDVLQSDVSSRNRLGLFRDEIDRAVAFYQGGVDPGTPQDYSQLVATEVVEISFRYFNGTDWQTQWDSAEENGFPSAVEINIAVDSTPQADVVDLNSREEGRYERYRSVVHLPLAEIDDSEDEDG